MIQKDVTVVGGGAAGLVAAIAAARNGAKTVILEHMDRVGRKILATGNGKCNYTNELQGVSFYRGEDPAFVLPVFEQFGKEETVAFFKELGIFPKTKKGYYYPASGQASSMLDVLRMELDYLKVEIHTSCVLKAIKKTGNSFMISTNDDKILTKTVIFATGLLASPKTGSDGSAIPYIEAFGHRFVDVVPALVQLQGKQAFFKSLAGIRAGIRIDLYIDERKTVTESGELQLTEYGISGIPIFQVSRYAVRALKDGKKVYARIDFTPDESETELMEELYQRFGTGVHGKTASETLIGMFHKKLIQVLLAEAGIGLHIAAAEVNDNQIKRLCRIIREFRVDIIGSKDFDAAQVCAGGVDTSQINGHTMESHLVRGLYFAGEVVDIDGTCGGYNLQWAWSSGYVAGSHAAESVGRERRLS